MIELPKLTPAQQAAGIDRIDENIALRSGAGCGKTFVLARRFTELLLRGGKENLDDPLSRFVALTFTDKAALEMSQRVRAMMQSFSAGAKGEDRRRWQGWIERLTEARISTIHSFCASLLRSCAIEAGLDPAFAVCADTVVTDRLLAEAGERAVLAAIEARDAQTADLLGGMNFDSLVKQVRGLVNQRSAVDISAYDDPQATLGRWGRQLDEIREQATQWLNEDTAIHNQLDKLTGFLCNDPGDKLSAVRGEVVKLVGRILSSPLGEAGEAFESLAELKVGNIGSAKGWGSKENVKIVRHTIKTLREALAGYAIFAGQLNEQDESAAATLQTLCRLATEANRLYLAEKKSRSIVDFTDLMTYSRDVLSASPPLREKLSAGIDQLLIDEAQDTDAMQLGMLLGILSGKGDPAGALPSGKLFLVGDAKQSIYRFRGAETEVFKNLCRQLGSDQQIDLDVSFRTPRPGSAFINHLFQPIMGQEYSPVRSSRTEMPDGPSVEILLADGTDERPLDSAESAGKAQAVITAERIDEMISRSEKLVWDGEAKEFRPVRAGDVAILFARMTNSLIYERELQKRDIPYHVISGMGFFRQQEVFDCLNALRAIDNPLNDIAFVGLLRSAMIGLDDNALLHIAENLSPPYLPNLTDEALASLAEMLDETQLKALRHARDMMRELAGWKDAVGIDELLRRVLRETGYEATLLSQYQGRRMVGNVRMLLDQARQATGQISLAEFIEQMDEQVLNESRYEQAPAAGEDENAVQLITIHKAKGLEYPVVFVPDLNVASQSIKDATLNRVDTGLVTKLLPGYDNDDETDEHDEKLPQPQSFAVAKWLEKRDQQRETLRKYYVALSRHEDHLVLVGANWRTKDGAFRNKGCFLNTLDEVFDITGVLEAGRCELQYSDTDAVGNSSGEKFTAQLSCYAPKPARSTGRKSDAPGQAILQAATSGADIAAGLIKLAAGNEAHLPLIGPIPASRGNVELAVTALSEFEQCPMLYHWRYELRAPISDFQFPISNLKKTTPGQEKNRKSKIENWKSINSLTLGTLLHRCMELLDFANPQPAEVLISQAMAEIFFENVEHIAVDQIVCEFTEMLEKFRSHELSGVLASLLAEDIYRELDFVSACGAGATIRGQIDLLYKAGGQWHVVDYKSDRVAGLGAEALAAKASRYELQMLIYAAAVARHTDTDTNKTPVDATLYFLRTGQTYKFEITPAAIASVETRVAKLAEDMIRSRRSGRFRKCSLETCDYCRWFL